MITRTEHEAEDTFQFGPSDDDAQTEMYPSCFAPVASGVNYMKRIAICKQHGLRVVQKIKSAQKTMLKETVLTVKLTFKRVLTKTRM